MKYAPSIPPPANVAGNKWETKGVGKVRPAKPVGDSQQVLQRQPTQAESRYGATGKIEKREMESRQAERRTYCRRVGHQAVPIELRSGKDRRQHGQREGDVMKHIDEEA